MSAASPVAGGSGSLAAPYSAVVSGTGASGKGAAVPAAKSAAEKPAVPSSPANGAATPAAVKVLPPAVFVAGPAKEASAEGSNKEATWDGRVVKFVTEKRASIDKFFAENEMASKAAHLAAHLFAYIFSPYTFLLGVGVGLCFSKKVNDVTAELRRLADEHLEITDQSKAITIALVVAGLAYVAEKIVRFNVLLPLFALKMGTDAGMYVGSFLSKAEKEADKKSEASAAAAAAKPTDTSGAVKVVGPTDDRKSAN